VRESEASAKAHARAAGVKRGAAARPQPKPVRMVAGISPFDMAARFSQAVKTNPYCGAMPVFKRWQVHARRLAGIG
jgi:hypothetical protein